MLLSSRAIASRLTTIRPKKRLDITPAPDINSLVRDGTASIDLRLGTWFVTMRARRWSQLNVFEPDEEKRRQAERSMSESYYVPFDKEFIIHPQSFVLAVTLEWIRMPLDLAGMVTGKSSWGRRGLIVETAPGVHPGFTGCLTLELTNVGDVPIILKPSTSICQFFLHEIRGRVSKAYTGKFFGSRKAVLGSLEGDSLLPVMS